MPVEVRSSEGLGLTGVRMRCGGMNRRTPRFASGGAIDEAQRNSEDADASHFRFRRTSKKVFVGIEVGVLPHDVHDDLVQWLCHHRPEVTTKKLRFFLVLHRMRDASSFIKPGTERMKCRQHSFCEFSFHA